MYSFVCRRVLQVLDDEPTTSESVKRELTFEGNVNVAITNVNFKWLSVVVILL